MEEEKIRIETRIWLEKELERRDDIEIIYKPIVFHDKRIRLYEHLNSLDPEKIDEMCEIDVNFYEKIKGWAIDPDVVALVINTNNNSKILPIVIENKSGSVGVKDLSQILMYSIVTQAFVGILCMDGGMSGPLKHLLENNVINYKGYNRVGILTEKKIGICQIQFFRDSYNFEILDPNYDIFQA